MVTKQLRQRLAAFFLTSSLFTLVTLTSAQVVDSSHVSVVGSVYSISCDSSDTLLIGGTFSRLNGHSRTNLGKVHKDGTLDYSFKPDPYALIKVLEGSPSISRIIRQPDGKYLVNGHFATIAGQNITNLARFNANDTLDTDFDPLFTGSDRTPVASLALQDDGKIIIGGDFRTVDGQSRSALARLHSDGSLDTNFNVSVSDLAPPSIVATYLQADGKILIRGSFTRVGTYSRTNFARLHPNGTLDTNFNAYVNGTIACMAIQANGQILLGGSFTNVAGQTRTNLARLNIDGTLDTSFNPAPNNTVTGLALQTDGKILVCGSFLTLAGQARTRLGRLNADGTLDGTFNYAPFSAPIALSIQEDGKVLVENIRLHNTSAPAQSLLAEDSAITWLREGTGPELLRTKFEGSHDGTNWTTLGVGQRITGGWQISGEGFTNLTFVRAVGTVQENTCTWTIQKVVGPLHIVSHPADSVNNAGTIATFRAQVIGSGPLSYQWFKNEEALANTANISLAHTPTLVLTNVRGADMGNYFLVASNASGSITSAVARLTVIDPLITTQPANRATNAGQSVQFTVGVLGTAPFSYQWRKNGAELVAGTNSTLTVTNVQVSDIAGYDVILSNTFGSTTSRVATLRFLANPDGLNPNVSGFVFATAIQFDGSIILGGSFSSVSSTTRNKVARLSPDGTLDKSFNPNVDRDVFSTAIQPDGKILIGGWFSQVGGQPRDLIARLNPNGTLDPGFRPVISGNGGLYAHSGVYSLALRPDGKILIAGDFRTVNGHSRTNIAQLLPDGSLDTNFIASANDIIYPMALQSDGKILVGGNFTNLNGTAHSRLARLHPDGTLDTTFNPKPNDLPLCIAVQPDGKILVGGVFNSIAGQSRANIARLNADGSLDETFTGSANTAVRSISLQSDGKVVLGGSFELLNGQSRNALGRLAQDGTLDETFTPGIGGGQIAYSAMHQLDGKVVVGGSFGLMRLNATEGTTGRLLIETNGITWLRTGPGAEAWRTEIDVSTNGSGWTSLGTAQRVDEGWRVSGITLPTNATARARAYISGGRYNASGWRTEISDGPLCIGRQPLDQTNQLGSTVTFDVEAGGTPLIGYQWYKNGAQLTNSSRISGTDSRLLVLSNIVATSAGAYSVVVTNSSTSITSEVAILTVLDPLFRSHPTNTTVYAGSNATFTINGSGTPPITYQWYKDGEKVNGAGTLFSGTPVTLTLTNVSIANEGLYWATLSNLSGIVTSSIAQLDVIDPYIRSQPQSQLVHAGQTAILTCAAGETAPFLFQWQKNGIAIPQATDATFTITNVQSADRGDYNVVVTNLHGAVTSSIARLDVNTHLVDGLNIAVNGRVHALASQPNGELLVGTANGVMRILQDGSIDTNFTVIANSSIEALALQPDGRILVGGSFTNLGGVSRHYVGRLLPDGSVDPNFHPEANYRVLAFAVQPDGKILVAGYFTSFGGTNNSRIARIHADGTLDTSFRSQVTSSGAGMFYLRGIALQPNGQIVTGGSISGSTGPQTNVARLNVDGSYDTSFSPPDIQSARSLVIQKDGRVIIGGGFMQNNVRQASMGRLMHDGTIDPSFSTPLTSDIMCVALQSDGKVVVGGNFNNHITRLNPEGGVDETFNPEVKGVFTRVDTLAIQGNGNIVFGGSFTSVSGQARTNVARLITPELPLDVVTTTSETVQWTRHGSGPELSHVTFETSIDGESWTSLGAGNRNPDGWQWTGDAIATPAFIRARGWVPGQGTSAWFIERMLTLEPLNPLILVNDNQFGFASNAFGFHIQGRSGNLIVLEGSTDLSNWISVATNTIGSGPIYFSDPDSTNLSGRYYRTRTP